MYSLYRNWEVAYRIGCAIRAPGLRLQLKGAPFQRKIFCVEKHADIQTAITFPNFILPTFPELYKHTLLAKPPSLTLSKVYYY